MNIKFKIKRVIEVSDWDKVVKDTYGRPYSFQQQDGSDYSPALKGGGSFYKRI